MKARRIGIIAAVVVTVVSCTDTSASRPLAGPAPQPTALVIAVEPAAPLAQHLVTFSEPFAAGGTWAFGDGSGDQGSQVQHRYADGGQYSVSVRMDDGRTATLVLTVGAVQRKLPDSLLVR